MPPLAFLNLGPWEIALIVFLALLLFGGKRLPALAKDLGNGIKEFRKSLSSTDEDTPQEQTTKLEERPKKKA
jgi:sec-independent protein translocase protein TatA